MPRLKGLSGQDSYSVSQQTDIFVFIQYRHMAPSKPVNTNLDTHEREAFETLLNKKEGSPVYVLVQGGKLLIKLMLFPPYFFFIRLPLVFFKKIVPKISVVGFFLKKNLVKVREQIKRRSEILCVLKENVIVKLTALMTVLKNHLEKLLENCYTPFKKIGIKSRDFIKVGIRAFLNSFAKFKVKKPFSFSYPLFYSFKALKKGGEILVSLSTSSKAILGKLLSKVRDSAALIGEQISERLNKVSKVTYLFLKKFKGSLEAIINKTSRNLKPLLGKIGLKKIKALLHLIEDSVLPKGKQTMQFLGKMGHILNPTPYLAFLTQIQPLQFLGYLKRFKISKISSPLKKIKLSFVKEYLKRFGRDFFKRGESLSLAFFNDVKKKAELIFQKTIRGTAHFLNYFITLALDFLRKALLQIRGFFKKIKAFFEKVKKFLVLFSKWCRIMVKFTWYLIKEIVRELHSYKA